MIRDCLLDLNTILDSVTSKSIAFIFHHYNHFNAEWTTNAELTRAQVPPLLRRNGLWLSYNKDLKTKVTERFIGSDLDASEYEKWTSDEYWELLEFELLAKGLEDAIENIFLNLNGYPLFKDYLKKLINKWLNSNVKTITDLLKEVLGDSVEDIIRTLLLLYFNSPEFLSYIRELLSQLMSEYSYVLLLILNQINSMNKFPSGDSGKFVTTIYQDNGVVSEVKDYISRTILADSSVEIPSDADYVNVVKNSAINFTTNNNLNVAFEAVLVPTKKYVDSQISESISSVYNYKGTKANYSNLPNLNNVVGDVWNVTNESIVGLITYPAGTNFAWDGSTWDPLGGLVDVINNDPLLGTSSTTLATINGHNITAKIPAFSDTNFWTKSSGNTMSPDLDGRNLTGIGTITADGAIYSGSDKNIKKDITFISLEDLEKVKKINIKLFKYIKDDILRYGVIAQELQDFGLSNLISEDNGILHVDLISFLMLKIAALEEEVKALKNK